MTWYKTSFGLKVEPIEVIRETGQTLVVFKYGRNQKVHKENSYEKHHRTLSEAHAYLKSRIENDISAAEARIEGYKTELAKLEAIISGPQPLTPIQKAND